MPAYASFFPSNFGPNTYLDYNASDYHADHFLPVTMLKIDCEGCEWSVGFTKWLDHICTHQIILELHVTPQIIRQPAPAGLLERMLRRLSTDYALFAAEGNPHCGRLPHTTRVCVELSWVRREPCGKPIAMSIF